MDAKVKIGMAKLEEFLQEEYVELYDEIKDSNNKVIALVNNSNTSKYFYKPTVGTLRYIVDSELHAYYLINKQALPDEIKQGLVGGDAGEGKYSDYASLNDVYGVTTDLKVYYCSNGLESLLGVNKDNLDKDDPLREVVFEKNPQIADVLVKDNYDKNNDGKINADEIKYVTTLRVDSTISDLSNLTNLKEITFDSVNLSSLSGIENCLKLNYVAFENYGGSSLNIRRL